MAKGFKTGGRKKGSRNKKTVLLEETGREALAKMLGPHAFDGDAHSLLIAIYKDKRCPIALRLDAAKTAIRFEKPALTAVDAKHSVEQKLVDQMTDAELDAELARLGALLGIGTEETPQRPPAIAGPSRARGL
jgi:hypothetical protein